MIIRRQTAPPPRSFVLCVFGGVINLSMLLHEAFDSRRAPLGPIGSELRARHRQIIGRENKSYDAPPQMMDVRHLY